MTPFEPRLHAALGAATNQILATLTAVAGRVSDSLGLMAQGGGRTGDRVLLISVQLDMRRNIDVLNRAFGEALNKRIAEELAPREVATRSFAATNWKTLSLVDDNEEDERMFSDRIAQQISHACEGELRELAAYTGGLLLDISADLDRNPLRAEVIGVALYRAIEAVTTDAEARKLLARELGAAMAKAMPDCYTQILLGLQARGVQPVELTVRQVEGPGSLMPGVNTGYASLSGIHSQRGDLDAPSSGSGTVAGGYDHGALRGGAPGPHTSMGGHTRSGVSARYGLTPSQADAQLMALLRHLTAAASRPVEFDAGAAPAGVGSAAGAAPAHATDGINSLMAVNMIRAHREELMQASGGHLDHMVIDVVGSLFDQILSDTRVPPQMARQIARLQLPVLRVALNDSSFFSSRRHPVRRFVNRIASLACAFDDFEEGPGKPFLERVSQLVQEIVEGDFDQIELYASKLGALEFFIAEQTHSEVDQKGAAVTLGSKETELRLQQRFTLQLQTALAPLPLPGYLRTFLSQVWSQAMLLAVGRDGADSDRARRYRRAARDLVMSVQPKGSPALRKKFLMQLPPLVKDLNEGMALIGWAAAAQREFFGKLLPAHAESLKGAAQSELDHNMMVKQLESIFGMQVPGAEALTVADPVPEIDPDVLTQAFSAEEVERVGLLTESAVNWSESVDIDLSDDTQSEADTGSIVEAGEAAAVRLAGIDIDLGLASADPAEPSRGPQLFDHIKLGFAYQMHLKDEWQKVRLAHVSAGRGFFVFTRGRKNQETISMTSRMLARMCESGRLRAVESTYLMERATHRARKQLAALTTTTRH